MASIQIVSGLVLMASAGSLSVSQHQASVTAHDRCHAEVRQLCTGIPSDTLSGCLKAHASQLSGACRAALADAPGRRSAN